MIKNHGVVALIQHDKKFLLLKDSRRLMLGHWSPPHGQCEKTDKNEEATVIREVKEETNLTVNPIKKVWTTAADTKIKTVSFWLTEIIEGEIKIDEQESSEYGWFTVDESLGLKLYPGTKKFFELVKQKILTIK